MKPLQSAILGLISLVALLSGTASPARALDARLSGAVSIQRSSAAIQQFLAAPGISYVQAYLRFGTGMPDDVIMAVDQEFIDGVGNPLFVSGGDWMALVGIQRSGLIWVAAGTTTQTVGNTPSTDRNWQIFNLGTRLKPDTWYRLRVEADFGKRRFRSFTIDGPGLARTLDLSAYLLDYPNYMPFSSRSINYYVVAMRSRGMMKTVGTPIAYFDDVEAGVLASNGTWVPVFTDNFEAQTRVYAQPLTSPVIDITRYSQASWYLERPESLVTFQRVPYARSGTTVAVAGATLN